MSRRVPAHCAPTVQHRSLLSVSSFAGNAAALIVAIVLALLATSGTYAYVSASQAVALIPGNGATTATIVAGTANLNLSNTTIPAANIYPGETRTAEILVTTTGSVGLELALTSITGISVPAFSATLAGGPCSSNGPALTAGKLGVVVTAAAPATLCLRLKLSADAPADLIGSAGTLVMTLTGAQI